MFPIGELQVAGRLHTDSFLLFAALAELIETSLEVVALLSLTLQLLFKLVNHIVSTRTGSASLSARAHRAGSRRSLAFHHLRLCQGVRFELGSLDTSSFRASCRWNCFGDLFSSKSSFDEGESAARSHRIRLNASTSLTFLLLKSRRPEFSWLFHCSTHRESVVDLGEYFVV